MSATSLERSEKAATAARNASPGMSAVTPSGIETKDLSDGTTSSTFLSPLTTYLHLLFRSSSPSWLDFGLLGTGLVTAIAAGVPFPLMGIIFGELVDNINVAQCEVSTTNGPISSSSDTSDSIQQKVLMLVYISLAAFVLIYIYTSTWSLFSQRLSHRLREAYFFALLRKEPTFFDSRHAGEVSARLSGDIQAIASGTGEKVGIFLASISFFVTAYVVGFVKDAQLAGILVSLVPAFLIMSFTCGAFIQKFAGIASDKMATGAKVVAEGLDNIAVVQTFGMSKRLEVKFAADMLIAKKAGIKKGIVAATQAGLLFFIAYSANALAFWQGSRKIADAAQGKGNSTVGEIYTVVFLLVDACIMLGSVAPLLPLFGGAASAYKKLRDDIQKESAIDSTATTGDRIPETTPGEVELRNVSFAYPSRPQNDVLKSVSLHFPAGKHTGIVGLSGSGKSTVAALLSRFYNPTKGVLYVDGHDIRDLNVRNLRELIGLVPQEPSLLDRSIFENIALGLINSGRKEHKALQSILLGPNLSNLASYVNNTTSLDIKSQEIVKLVLHAADLAAVTPFIEKLSQGWMTKVGSGGQLVSGGQRQRIALARALVKNPRILLLDEATSSLDSSTEKIIQDAVSRVAKDRTVISIAHRLSTVRDVDNIIVMKCGEVLEEGTYKDLVAYGGEFASMVKLQGHESDKMNRSGETYNSELEKAGLDEKVKVNSLAEAGISSAQGTNTPSVFSTQIETGKKSDPSVPRGWPAIKEIACLARPWLTWLLLAAVASIIVGCTFTASGLLFGHTVGNLSTCEHSIDHVLWAGKFFGGLLFMLACVELLANMLSWSSFGLVAEKLVYRVRILSFRSLFSQGLEWHRAEERSPATLLSIITKDSVALHGFSGSIMGTIFSIVVNFLVAVILSHIIAWKIALVFLITVPILLGSGILQVRAIARFEERHSHAFSSAIAITVEAVAQIKTVAMLGLEEHVVQSYKRTLAAPKREMIGASLYTNIWLAIANSTGLLIYAFAYWWGSRLIMKAEYTQTQFFIILVAVLVSAQLWGQMFALAPEVTKAKDAAKRLMALINDGPSGRPGDDAILGGNNKDIEATAEASNTPVAGFRHEKGLCVTFENVSFAYPSRPDTQILHNISFSVQPGQYVALVGPSGAGKSTVMALMQHLFVPTSGCIALDGSSNLGPFADDVAIVPQDSSLFSGTVAFNVSLGARTEHEASLTEVEEACKLAHIHDVVSSLPEGYESECGPNAQRLSGGQKQRLSIARALVRKPRLLLLDESTSALDAESEKAVQDGLDGVRRDGGVTVIAITHKLQSARNADMIVVIDGGRVVGTGKYEDVMKIESFAKNVEAGQLV